MAINTNAHIVADMIENYYSTGFKGVAFNMTTWRSRTHRHPILLRWADNKSCGTVGCMAGWCVIAARGGEVKDFVGMTETPIYGEASRFLGIESEALASSLFAPLEYVYEVRRQLGLDSDAFGFKSIHPLHVVAVLRHFANTGEVRWEQFEKPTMDAWNKEMEGR